MSNIEKFKTLILTAAAAAAVQSCADSAAELVDTAAGAPGDTAAASPVCPAATVPVSVGAEVHCRLSGAIDQDVHLFAGPLYQLDGRVEIGQSVDALGVGGSPRTLSIDPGVQIYAATRDASLVVARGSRIFAEGDDGAPIVFTSAYDLGFDDELGLPSRANIAAPRGEWGGVVVNGLALVAGVDGEDGARCFRVEEAAACERSGEAQTGLFGGAPGVAGSSGALVNVQIRFAGAYATTADGGAARLPALALNAVGDATRVERLTIVNAYGDGLKLIGGDVDATDVAVVAAGDDGVEWDLGYRGALSRVVVAHDRRLGDGDNGFEGASLEAAPEGRLANLVASSPRLVDVAAIGDEEVSNAGIVLENGTEVAINGATVSGRFARGGLDIDGEDTYARLKGKRFARLKINSEGMPALSSDFDDKGLVALASANGVVIKPIAVTLAEALAGPDASARAPAPPPAAPSETALPARAQPASVSETPLAANLTLAPAAAVEVGVLSLSVADLEGADDLQPIKL